MAITIPERHHKPIIQLVTLTQAELDTFLSFLDHLTPSLNIAKSIDEVPASLPLSRFDIELIVEMLISLHSVAVFEPGKLDSFLGDICFAAQQLNSEITKRPHINELSWHRFRGFLQKALSNDALRVNADLRSNAISYDNLFWRCSIKTDLRPVTKENSIAAAIITHSLKLEYQNNGESVDFYLSLDDDDIRKLRRSLDEAANKGEILRGLLTRNNIPRVITSAEE